LVIPTLLCVLTGSLGVRSQAPPANPVQIENGRPGTTAWKLTNPALAREIEGYASLASVDRGGAIRFFVSTAAPTYTIDVFRLGWYGGTGGRRLLGPIQRTGRVQAMPQPDPATGLIECTWVDPYVLTIPNDPDPSVWPSGVYVAKLTASGSGRQSYIVFVLRDDDRPSDFLFQTSVTTYQAYNNWGGKSLYGFNSVDGAARKVSFNRPYGLGIMPGSFHGVGAGEFLTNVQPADQGLAGGWEAPMLRWLEREGYDVTYNTNLDTHVDGGQLRLHRAFLSIGHDEYWTWEMRDNVEAALAQGVSLGFFASNAAYWQVRLEPSSTGDANRTMVGYKGTALSEDPLALDGDHTNDHLVTVRFQDPPVSRPEDALIGVRYLSNPVDAEIVMTNAGHWVFGGTGLENGDRLPKLIGYEADYFAGEAPPGTVILAHSPYGSGLASDMTLYTTASGATVFATGTMQWSYGLDDYGVPEARPSRLSPEAQQITRNVLARFTGAAMSSRPSKPAGLSAQAGDRLVTLTWTASQDPAVAGYNVYRATTSNVVAVGTPINVGSLVTGTTFTDTTVANGVTYYYALVAIDTDGDASPASDIVSATPSGASGGGACLDDTYVTALPISFAFEGTDGGCLTSGFTTVMRNAGSSTAPNFVAARATVTGGLMSIQTASGDVIRSQNDAENAFAVRFDALGGAEIRTTLRAPLGQVENYENSGIWFGLSEDNYVKLVAAHEDGHLLELSIEENGAFGGTGRVALTPAMLDSATSSVTLILKLTPGATAGTPGAVEAQYQIDGGPIQGAGNLSSVPAAFFTTASYGGVLQTHAGNSTPFDARYESFAVARPGQGPSPDPQPAPCLDPAVVSGLPVSLGFGGSSTGCPVGGFTTVMPNAVSGPTDSFLPGLLALATGSLNVTTAPGDAIRGENAAANALAVRVTATSALEISATLKGPLQVQDNYDSAGIWFGLGEDDYVKLTAAANDGPTFEFSLEEAGAFGGAGRVIMTPAAPWTGSAVTLVLRLTPSAGENGAGTAEAFYRLDGGAELSAGLIASVPARFFTSASHAGIVHTHAGSASTFIAEYDDFAVRALVTAPPPDTTAPAAPAGLTATPGDGRVSLSWTANQEADLAGYRVYRATSASVPATGTPLSGTSLLTSSAFTDTTAVNFTDYWYVAVAVDQAGNASAPAGAVKATPLPSVQGFIERNGRLVFEAERYDTKVSRYSRQWTLRTSPAGFAGTGAMVAEPNSGANIDSDFARRSPELRFLAHFTTPGTYYVWIRGYGASGSDNSLHVGLDGREVRSADRLEVKTYGAWVWSKSTLDGVATLAVTSAGLHTINVWMREDGFRLDRLLLTTSATEVPSGTGPDESLRSDGK
jgi:hypothetical protein